MYTYIQEAFESQMYVARQEEGEKEGRRYVRAERNQKGNEKNDTNKKTKRTPNMETTKGYQQENQKGEPKGNQKSKPKKENQQGHKP